MSLFGLRLFRALGSVPSTADPDARLILQLAATAPPMSLATVKAALDAAASVVDADGPATANRRVQSLQLPNARNACPRFV